MYVAWKTFYLPRVVECELPAIATRNQSAPQCCKQRFGSCKFIDALLRDSFMDLLLDACHASRGTLVFVSHDERLAARFDERLSLSAVNRTASSMQAEDSL